MEPDVFLLGVLAAVVITAIIVAIVATMREMFQAQSPLGVALRYIIISLGIFIIMTFLDEVVMFVQASLP